MIIPVLYMRKVKQRGLIADSDLEAVDKANIWTMANLSDFKARLLPPLCDSAS